MLEKIVVFAVAIVLGGCVVPTTYGPYYRPVYPDMNSPGSPWLPYFGSAVQSRLRFKFGNRCYMQLQALPSDPDFLLSWSLETYEGKEGKGSGCDFVVGNEPLSLEVGAKERHEADAVYRIFTGPVKPKMDFSEGVQPYSSRVSEVPSGQQTYTVSIPLRLDFKETIPASISIVLPEIQVGNHQAKLPLLTLKRVETGGNIKAYIPASVLPMTTTESIVSYGMGTGYHRTTGSMAVFYAGAALWYDDPVIRVASSFSGRDDVKTSTMIIPGIRGEILIKVLSGKGIAFPDSRVTWITEDGEKIVQHIDSGQLGLAAYRTTLTDVGRFQESGSAPRFIALFAGLRPERARITLPRLEVMGKTWPIKPIDFEYSAGGIGFLAWP